MCLRVLFLLLDLQANSCCICLCITLSVETGCCEVEAGDACVDVQSFKTLCVTISYSFVKLMLHLPQVYLSPGCSETSFCSRVRKDAGKTTWVFQSPTNDISSEVDGWSATGVSEGCSGAVMATSWSVWSGAGWAAEDCGGFGCSSV